MISVKAGESFRGKSDEFNVYLLLGSCVGIVIEGDDFVGYTHGRNPREVEKQIDDMIRYFHRVDRVRLFGGMEGMGIIGRDNSIAGKKALNESGLKYEDCTGIGVVIVNNYGTITLREI